MRLSLLAFAFAVALTASGCDSSGIDNHPCTHGCTGGTGGTGGGTGGGGTGGSGGGTGGSGGGTGGSGGGTTPTARFTFAPVNPAATYLRTDQSTAFPTPFLLADYGLQSGDVACFRTAGDYAYAPGELASGRPNTPLATAVFSASNVISATTERIRVKDAVDGDWNVVTPVTFGTGAVTDIDEDFDATNGCYTVPAGATHFFLSAYDDAFLDNTDVNAGGQEFGVFVGKQ